MTKELMLLRHAKSSWEDPEVQDHERPLNKRGKQNAITMGKYLKRERLVPDLIISSTAKRANKTANIIAKTSGYEKKMLESEMLYSAIPENYKKVINEIPDKNNKVLLVGHNPILEEVIARILGESRIMKTCSLAHIELSLDSWKQFSFNTKSKLIDLVVARELEEGIIDN